MIYPEINRLLVDMRVNRDAENPEKGCVIKIDLIANFERLQNKGAGECFPYSVAQSLLSGGLTHEEAVSVGDKYAYKLKASALDIRRQTVVYSNTNFATMVQPPEDHEDYGLWLTIETEKQEYQTGIM